MAPITTDCADKADKNNNNNNKGEDYYAHYAPILADRAKTLEVFKADYKGDKDVAKL